jgi:phospholipid/cholesterol/gamma-HCH transport system permease protein
MLAAPAPWPALRAALRRQGLGGWRTLRLGALAVALAISPSTYRRPWRQPLAAQLLRAAFPLLPWFTLLAAIASLVVIRIVLVTAQSYGLSQYALGMVVRVLVMELIPLSAALAVALRVALPMAAELAAELAAERPAARTGQASPSAAPAPAWLRRQFAPRVLAGALAVLLLALVGSLLALVLAYLLAHGFTPYAFGRFTRLVGQIFDPVVSLVFVLKTGALALAVSVVPLAAATQGREGAAADAAVERGAVRLFVLVLAIEILALMGNYLP